jgi:hypothetical protein
MLKTIISKIKPSTIALIIAAGFIIGVVILTIIFAGSQTDDSVEIVNISKNTNGQSRNDKLLGMIKEALFVAIKNASGRDEITANDIKDAAVRDNSYKQSYDTATKTNKVEFMVDIASFKQSYQVYYEWQSNKANTDSQYVGEYGTVALKCPSKDLLIYGEFKCIDENTPVSEGGSYDPILKYLPYDAASWSMQSAYEDKKIVLYVSMMGPSMHVFITEDEYKSMVREWFGQIGLDYHNYTINYSWNDN